jgi:hypothetical protein
MTNAVSALVFASILVIVDTAYAQETPHYDVVAEYVRQLTAMHNIQEQSSKELAVSKNRMPAARRRSPRPGPPSLLILVKGRFSELASLFGL